MKNKILATLCFAFFAFSACNNNSSENAAGKKSTAVDKKKPGSIVDSLMNAMVSDTPVAVEKNEVPVVAANAANAKNNAGTATVKNEITLKHPEIAMDNEGIYSHADVMPVFPGGQNALNKYFDENIRYPKSAVEAGRIGRAVVSFVVDENGHISDVKNIGRKIGYGLDEEAIRVVSNMPKWAPGTVKGKPVKTRMTLPILFRPKNK
ncbi:MAG: energy transducer TonB [Bacteroidetes bacterium]|nr:energy transducer TonB [Bacteroidota bacterium]